MKNLMIKRTLRFFFTVILVLTFTGCWIPEKFTATVTINKDGSHSFIYEGILTNGFVLGVIQKGMLTPADEAKLKDEEKTLLKAPGFKKATYLGKGRYEVLVERHYKAGEAGRFISRDAEIFSVIPGKDGIITVTGLKLTPGNIKEFNEFGAKVDGKLKVTVADGVTVISHNAMSEPSFFGLFGAYEWEIKSPDVAPTMKVRPGS